MNFLHLKYLIEVEKYESISKAAQHLYINQPRLSKIIKEIEGLGTGKNLSEKLRNIIEIGIENLEKKQEK
mgnify:CR=1 FL=1